MRLIKLPHRHFGTALIFMPVVAFAQTSSEELTDFRWYVKSTIGQAASRASEDDLNQQFAAAGLNASVTAFDDADVGYGFALGYQWRNNWSVELGLANLGEFAVDIEGEYTDATTFYRGIEDLHPESAKGVFIAADYRWQFSQHWAAHARAGILEWRGDYDTKLIQADERHVGDHEQRGTDPFLGLAVGYSWTPRWDLNLGWERYQFTNHDVDYLNLGLLYRFGAKTKPLAPPITKAAAPIMITQTAAEPAPMDVSDCELFTGALTGVNFASGSAELTKSAREPLYAAVLALRKNPAAKIEIHAHTDAQGADETNFILSDARANAVMQYFISQGIDATRLSAKGFGEMFPLQTNETPAGRAVNRRVELKLKNVTDC